MQCGKTVYVERQLLRAAPRAVHFAALFTAFRCVAPVSARTLRRRGLAETDSSACGGGGREGHVRMERERHGRAAGALLFCPTGDGVCVGVCVGGGGGGKPTPKAAVGWTAQVYVVRRMQGAECVLAAAAAHRTDCLCWGKPAVHARSPPRGERRPLRVPGRERDTWMGASAREVATWTPDGAPGQLPAPSRSAGGMSARPCAANAKVMPCDGNTCLLFTAFS